MHENGAKEIYPLTRAMEVFAPNPAVRKRVRDERRRYERLLGRPSVAQRLAEQYLVRAARKASQDEVNSPANYAPKEEPYKRYEYSHRNKSGTCPYSVTHPERELGYRIYDIRTRVRDSLFGAVGHAFTSARGSLG